MANYNRVILVGNLTRDPQLKYLPSQTAVVEFGLAINRKYKTADGQDREEVTYVDISAFGKQAEVINQYCQKGRPLLVEGRLKYDSWEDKQGGGKRSKLTVVVENFQFLGSRPGAGEGGPEGQTRPAARPAPARPGQQQAAPPAPEQPFPDEQSFKDDDIPF